VKYVVFGDAVDSVSVVCVVEVISSVIRSVTVTKVVAWLPSEPKMDDVVASMLVVNDAIMLLLASTA
jgi:hypothetical protein